MSSDDENRLSFWIDEAHSGAAEHAGKNNTDEDETRKEPETPNYPSSLQEEDMEIVLRRSKLEMIINVAVPKTMMLSDDRIIFAPRSCADGNQLSPMETAVSMTSTGDQDSKGVMSKMVKYTSVEMAAQLKVVLMIASGLTKRDKPMSLIAKFVAGSVEKKARKVDCDKNEPK